jgi:hypothetical protein
VELWRSLEVGNRKAKKNDKHTHTYTMAKAKYAFPAAGGLSILLQPPVSEGVVNFWSGLWLLSRSVVLYSVYVECHTLE